MASDARRLQGLYWDRALYLVEGCAAVDEGCANCWACSFAQRWGNQSDLIDAIRRRWSGLIRFRKDKLSLPESVSLPTTWAVWNDLCQERVKEEFILSSLLSMLGCSRHTFLVLTKRIARLWDILDALETPWPDSAEHVWFGTSISRTSDSPSDLRLMQLAVGGCSYPRVFLSIAPMLGPVDISSLGRAAKSIDLIICECESGPKRRKVKTKDLDNLIGQCLDFKIQLFIKQWDFTGHKIIKTGELPVKYQEFTKLPF